jgi:hypothetical protein
MATQTDGMAERDAALLMLNEMQKHHSGRITVGADKAYGTRDFVSTARELRVTPHVSQNAKNGRSGFVVLSLNYYITLDSYFSHTARVSLCRVLERVDTPLSHQLLAPLC